MSKKIAANNSKRQWNIKGDCITVLPASQVVKLLDFASALFRYHTALIGTVEVGFATLGKLDSQKWQLAIRNFETAETELDKAWEAVKAQGYTSKAAAYAAYIELCSH